MTAALRRVWTGKLQEIDAETSDWGVIRILPSQPLTCTTIYDNPIANKSCIPRESSHLFIIICIYVFITQVGIVVDSNVYSLKFKSTALIYIVFLSLQSVERPVHRHILHIQSS
jgi:hypothetical protein